MGAMPDRITIFRRPIQAICVDEQDVMDQVRITVVHEVAHHFGIDDERLHELGYG
jgi:predicted Zn-dependent protease with MMP-like domain